MTETLDSHASERITTGLFVAAVCALMLATMGRAVALLAVALLVSYVLWLARFMWPPASRVIPAFAVAVAIQCVHLLEEYRTGFYRIFPSAMGSEAWSARRFLAFNLVWLAVFVVAGVGLQRVWRPAYLIALFLAIGGGIGNGLGHIMLAIRVGGYFPGVYTAPLALLSGAFLAFQLFRPARAIEAAL
jgi:hypothetical protein